MKYPWVPFTVPRKPTDSMHDIAELTSWWIQLTDPLLDKLRSVGYKSVELCSRGDMSNYAWVVVTEDIVNPKNPPWPLIWEIVRHSGLGAGCGNGHDVQLDYFQRLRTQGPDRTHGRRGWTNAPCRECFPEQYAEAVKNGAHK